MPILNFHAEGIHIFEHPVRLVGLRDVNQHWENCFWLTWRCWMKSIFLIGQTFRHLFGSLTPLATPRKKSTKKQQIWKKLVYLSVLLLLSWSFEECTGHRTRENEQVLHRSYQKWHTQKESRKTTVFSAGFWKQKHWLLWSCAYGKERK